MTKPLRLDPLALLRDGINKLEGAANAYATGKMQTDQFSQLLARWIKVSLGVQHVAGRVLAKVYARLDVPSRTELAALASAVQRVEDKVDALLPPAQSLAPRPARTRRAPEPVAAAVAPAASVPAVTPAPARRAPARKASAQTAGKATGKTARKPGARRGSNGEARP